MCKNVLFEAILLGKVSVRHILREIYIFRPFNYSSLIIIEAHKRTHLCQIDDNIIKATNASFGPKHVGDGAIYIIIVNLVHLRAFLG
jgi:hypothetical protein